MSDVSTETITELSKHLDKSQATIRRWIREGKLEATKSGRGYLIPYSEKNSDFITAEIWKRFEKPAAAYNPKELAGYSEWHQVLDEFAWLLKVCYSDKDLVRRKLFRTDIIFANYIKAHRVTLKKVRNIFAANQTGGSQTITKPES